MSKVKRPIFISLLVVLNLSLLAAEPVNCDRPLRWANKAVYYYESSKLTIDLPEQTGICSLQLWSSPPFGERHKLKEQEVELCGGPLAVDVELSFDDSFELYVTEDDLENRLDELGIENEEERDLVRKELYSECFDIMNVTARLYRGSELIAESPEIGIAVSFGW